MSKHIVFKHFGSAAAFLAAAGLLIGSNGIGQTPEQQKAWEAERARVQAAEKAQAQQLAQERAARKADPMRWVRTLDPMSAGGWEFRTIATDGSWAIFSSSHQLTRSRQLVTMWLRQEYAEPQTGYNGKYLSVVEKVQYDCKKLLTRTLMLIYYTANNIQGGSDTESADPKETPWTVIVPGTRDESSSQWACTHTTS